MHFASYVNFSMVENSYFARYLLLKICEMTKGDNSFDICIIYKTTLARAINSRLKRTKY